MSDTVSVQPSAAATTAPGVETDVFGPTIRFEPLDGLHVVQIGTVRLNAGSTSKVQVPVLPAPVIMNVKPLPTSVGVTLTSVNWPAVKIPELPVIPAVPLYVTVPVKLVTVTLFASCAVNVIPVMGVPAVWGDVIGVIASGPGLALVYGCRNYDRNRQHNGYKEN